MPNLFLPDLRLHYLDDGPKDGPALVLLHCLGMDATLWDHLLPLLPPGLRLIRPDMRGHGQSDVPAPPYSMGALIRDLERLLDHLQVKDAVLLGLSIGGLIAQGLAVKRLDLVRGLILSNTAHRLGAPSLWQGRIAQVEQGGLAAIAPATMERWFARPFRAEQRHRRPDVAHQMVADRPQQDSRAGIGARVLSFERQRNRVELGLRFLDRPAGRQPADDAPVGRRADSGLALLNRLGDPHASLAGELTTYPQVLVNVRVKERRALESVPAVAEAVARIEAALVGHGRLLVRYSGTEPLLRIYTETTSRDRVQRILGEGRRIAGV